MKLDSSAIGTVSLNIARRYSITGTINLLSVQVMEAVQTRLNASTTPLQRLYNASTTPLQRLYNASWR
jgi:hypothetical protein